MSLKHYVHPPKSGKKPESMVILLHGLGANGQDLIGLAQYWQDSVPDAVFISPDAPFPCDMAPVGFQWFSLQDWSPQSIVEGVKAALPILTEFMEEMLGEYGVPASRLVLAGFSQGTMMSLSAGPNFPQRIAGVLGYSGALVGGADLVAPTAQKFPVHLIHGEADGVVPVESYHMAKRALELAGYSVSGHTTPGLGHNIDEEGVESGGAFLQAVLA